MLFLALALHSERSDLEGKLVGCQVRLLSRRLNSGRIFGILPDHARCLGIFSLSGLEILGRKFTGLGAGLTSNSSLAA